MRHDNIKIWFFPAIQQFQSTCLREARLPNFEDMIVKQGFQSTCLREARHRYDNNNSRLIAFQSTCLREARPQRSRQMSCGPTFQSTCLREARPKIYDISNHVIDFNPRAYVRHDRVGDGYIGVAVDFNPRAYVRHDESKLQGVSSR